MMLHLQFTCIATNNCDSPICGWGLGLGTETIKSKASWISVLQTLAVAGLIPNTEGALNIQVFVNSEHN